MELAAGSKVLSAIAEYGILGLGWILFLFMVFRERVERNRYSDLVIHIIQYFTKVRMVEHDESNQLPPALFDISGVNPSRKRRTRRRSGALGDDKARDDS